MKLSFFFWCVRNTFISAVFRLTSRLLLFFVGCFLARQPKCFIFFGMCAREFCLSILYGFVQILYSFRYYKNEAHTWNVCLIFYTQYQIRQVFVCYSDIYNGLRIFFVGCLFWKFSAKEYDKLALNLRRFRWILCNGAYSLKPTLSEICSETKW